MDLAQIIGIASGIAGLIATIISIVVGVLKVRDSRKKIAEAKTAEEQAQAQAELMQAEADLRQKLITGVEELEKTFKPYEKVLASSGLKTGTLKRTAVLAELKSYAAEKGYAYDAEKWETELADTVNLTNNVNAKK